MMVLYVQSQHYFIQFHRRILGCVDGFDQDEAESKRDERA
jgi:hypothetical protein